MIACCGNRLPAVNRISKAMLPRNRIRATKNATADAKNSVMMTAGNVIQNELTKGPLVPFGRTEILDQQSS